MQYLKKEVSDEDKHFLHADKHESLLQIDTMILMGIVKHFQSFQNIKFTISLQYLNKEVRDEFDLEVQILWVSSHVYCYLFLCTARL